MPVTSINKLSSYYFFNPLVMTEERFVKLLKVCKNDLGVANYAALTNPEEFDKNADYLEKEGIQVENARKLINQPDLVEKLSFAKSIGFPYCSPDGEVFPEILEKDISKNPLKAYLNSKDSKNSDLDDIDMSMYSVITAYLNRESVERFHRLLHIDTNVYKMIESKIKDEEMDLNDPRFELESFELLLPSNPFIDLNVFDEIINETDDPTNGFMRSGQR